MFSTLWTQVGCSRVRRSFPGDDSPPHVSARVDEDSNHPALSQADSSKSGFRIPWPNLRKWFGVDRDPLENAASPIKADGTPEVLLSQAENALDQGRYRRASDLVEDVLESQPQNTQAWLMKGRIEQISGHQEQAIDAYHCAIASDADNPEAALQIAAAELKQNRAGCSAQILRRLIDCPQAGEQNKAQARWLLGQAYLRLERWDLALAELLAASQTRPMTIDDWYTVSWARVRAGDIEGARQEIAFYLQQNPNHAGYTALQQTLYNAPSISGAVLPAIGLEAPSRITVEPALR